MNIPNWFEARAKAVWALLKNATEPCEVWLLASGEFTCSSKIRRRSSATMVGRYTPAVGLDGLTDDMWFTWRDVMWDRRAA